MTFDELNPKIGDIVSGNYNIILITSLTGDNDYSFSGIQVNKKDRPINTNWRKSYSAWEKPKKYNNRLYKVLEKIS